MTVADAGWHSRRSRRDDERWQASHKKTTHKKNRLETHKNGNCSRIFLFLRRAQGIMLYVRVRSGDAKIYFIPPSLDTIRAVQGFVSKVSLLSFCGPLVISSLWVYTFKNNWHARPVWHQLMHPLSFFRIRIYNRFIICALDKKYGFLCLWSKLVFIEITAVAAQFN